MSSVDSISPVSSSFISPPSLDVPHLPYLERRETVSLSPALLETSFSLRRPKLDPPETLFEGKESLPSAIIHFVNYIQNLEKTNHRIFESLLEAIQTNNDIAFEESLTLEKELLLQEKNRAWWDTLRKVFVCLVGAASVISGGFMILAPGSTTLSTIAGFTLIGSGALSVLGTALYDTKTHTEIGLALSLASSTLGVVGAGMTFFSPTATLSQMIPHLLRASFSILESTTKTMTAISEQKMTQLRAKDTLVQEKLQTARLFEVTFASDIEEQGEGISYAMETALQALRMDETTKRKIISQQRV